MTSAAVRFDKVDVVFGDRQAEALSLLDQGTDRDRVLERTGAVAAVYGADIAVEEGEICVLMGLSGSGKSSLLRCVNRLNAVSRGRVLVADSGSMVDVADCPPATLRDLRSRRISMVFQQFALMPWRTIRENVGLGLELRGLSRAERAPLIEEKLALVRLEQWADMRPHELSGGMQQRVGLARALATDADILLMDEPFSALDPLIRDHLQDELLDLQRRLAKTIIFVSHDLDEALKIGNRIAIMEGGRIVQYGRPEEIVTRPADDYVRQFVAGVNPLNVLRARSLMRPVADLARPASGAGVCLDRAGELVCPLEDGGRVADGAQPGPLAGPDTPMRALIEHHRESGRPILVLDESRHLLGVVDGADLIAGMARRPA